jgi:hypothetical protein
MYIHVCLLASPNLHKSLVLLVLLSCTVTFGCIAALSLNTAAESMVAELTSVTVLRMAQGNIPGAPL